MEAVLANEVVVLAFSCAGLSNDALPLIISSYEGGEQCPSFQVRLYGQMRGRFVEVSGFRLLMLPSRHTPHSYVAYAFDSHI